MNANRLAGYILTGGKNSRMGGEIKFFLQKEGQTFGQILLEKLRGLDRTYLSVNEEEPYRHLGVPMVVDAYDAIGPMGGILSGLQALPDTDLFVTGSDMPFWGKELMEDLILAYEKKPVLTLPILNGRIQPLPGIYPAGLLPLLKQQVQAGNYRLRDLLHSAPFQTVETEDPGIRKNINTPEDCRRYL